MGRLQLRRTAPGLFAGVLVLSLLGCGQDRPPWNCSWAHPPSDVTSKDVTGEYTGSYFGKPMSLTLAADGMYTSDNLAAPEWLRSTPVSVKSGTWEFHEVIEGRGIPFVDIPGVGDHEAIVALDDGDEKDGTHRIDLSIAGTRDVPELYLTVLPYEERYKDSKTCDNFPRLKKGG